MGTIQQQHHHHHDINTARKRKGKLMNVRLHTLSVRFGSNYSSVAYNVLMCFDPIIASDFSPSKKKIQFNIEV